MVPRLLLVVSFGHLRVVGGENGGVAYEEPAGYHRDVGKVPQGLQGHGIPFREGEQTAVLPHDEKVHVLGLAGGPLYKSLVAEGEGVAVDHAAGRRFEAVKIDPVEVFPDEELVYHVAVRDQGEPVLRDRGGKTSRVQQSTEYVLRVDLGHVMVDVEGVVQHPPGWDVVFLQGVPEIDGVEALGGIVYVLHHRDYNVAFFEPGRRYPADVGDVASPAAAVDHPGGDPPLIEDLLQHALHGQIVADVASDDEAGTEEIYGPVVMLGLARGLPQPALNVDEGALHVLKAHVLLILFHGEIALKDVVHIARDLRHIVKKGLGVGQGLDVQVVVELRGEPAAQLRLGPFEVFGGPAGGGEQEDLHALPAVVAEELSAVHHLG